MVSTTEPSLGRAVVSSMDMVRVWEAPAVVEDGVIVGVEAKLAALDRATRRAARRANRGVIGGLGWFVGSQFCPLPWSRSRALNMERGKMYNVPTLSLAASRCTSGQYGRRKMGLTPQCVLYLTDRVRGKDETANLLC